LVEETNPDVIAFQLDTHWTASGGADPAFWIRKLKNRIPVVHFKDYAIDPFNYDTVLGNTNKQFAEIGRGNLNWEAIKDACDYAGVEWYSVEQDRTYIGAFESLKISIDFMKNTLGIK
jgi:sugar phosphate isomerase/epimerase